MAYRQAPAAPRDQHRSDQLSAVSNQLSAISLSTLTADRFFAEG
jgi:hypothetical protein